MESLASEIADGLIEDMEGDFNATFEALAEDTSEEDARERALRDTVDTYEQALAKAAIFLRERLRNIAFA